MLGLVKRVFSSNNRRQIQKMQLIVDKINALEKNYLKMSDEGLRAQTDILKARLKAGENLNDILPDFISETLKEGILYFDHKIVGFANKDAILTGVETRSSSPVTINRNEEYMSNILGIYPCGEGAGYAGGITSAAIDGIKVATKIIEKI